MTCWGGLGTIEIDYIEKEKKNQKEDDFFSVEKFKLHTPNANDAKVGEKPTFTR